MAVQDQVMKILEKSVENGINKINVGCDFMNANTKAIKTHLEKKSRY